MTANTPKGYPVEGRREDLEEISLQAKHSTVVPRGVNRRALDVMNAGVYAVADDQVAESGSNTGTIVITGHSAKPGDLIRLKTTANSLDEFEMHVDSTTANSITFAGRLSNSITMGDTFDILRYVTPRYDSTGASLSTVDTPPLRFLLNGDTQTVIEDTGTPSNNAPLPVKLTSVTGDINITAGDINVQTSHTGASYDSMRIGDGTNLMAVNSSLEAQVRDDDAITELEAILAKLIAAPSTEAKQDDVITALGSLLTELEAKADLSETQPVSVSSSALPTGAATEATLSALAAEDFATETTLDAVNTKLAAIQTAVQLLDNAVNGSNQLDVAIADVGDAATEATLSSIDGKDFATDTTLAAQSAKLPASLGPKASSGSLSVTFASDQTTAPSSALDVIDFVRIDFSSSNISTSSYTELISSTSAITRKISIFLGTGTPMYLAVGASSSEVDKFIISPGMDRTIEVNIPAGSRLSLKSIGSAITASTMIVNLMG